MPFPTVVQGARGMLMAARPRHSPATGPTGESVATEAAESAARAAEEAARDAAIANSGVNGSTPTSTASG